MLPKSRFVGIGLTLLILVILAACAPAPTPVPTAAPPTAVPPTKAPVPTVAPTTVPAATKAPEATKAPVATTAPTTAPTAAPVAVPTLSGTRRLSVGTGAVGGVFYVYGGGIASVLSKNINGTQLTAESTAGSVDNLKLLNAKKGDLALAFSDTSYEALKGEGNFKALGSTPVKALAVLYFAFNHLVVFDDSNIKTVADLKGKKVSTSSPGTGSEIVALRTLEAAGLDPDKDITRERLGAQESANAMKDRKIDAFFFHGSNIAAIIDLAATPGVKIRLLPQGDLLPKIIAKYGPVYSVGIIPKGVYKGVDVDTQAVASTTLLVVRDDFPEDVAYWITRTLFEKKSDLVVVHKSAQELTSTGSSIAFHPGAIKYFKEKNMKYDDIK
ncbi:MAG: TAXI family TRAP transporter solute-binding subunit [Chloroflexi bacterium]|nr:TAXI family TRAP transporter solute-binding subunit [Chloroflexota bacterium]